MKLSKLHEEYIPTRPILDCFCKTQECAGRFVKIRHWQTVCQWECIKLGYATRMDLNHNIFKNMKLTLTIQELEEPKTKEIYKGVFGTLTLQSHRDQLAEDLLEWAEKDKKYQEALALDEETPEVAPDKPTLQSINFALNIKSAPGLEEIIDQLTTDAINLDRKEARSKAMGRLGIGYDPAGDTKDITNTVVIDTKTNEIQN